MKGKKTICRVIYVILVIMSVVLLVMFTKTTDCFCLSSDIDVWGKYGTVFSSWILPFLTAINVLVLFLVNNQIQINTEIDVLKDNKFKILFTKFETFRTNFLDAHRQLQEAVDFNNQQACFDNWKTCFYDFYNQMGEISPSIKDCEYMKWWVKAFEAHTNVINFTPEGEYNPANFSREWSTNISKLYSELCNYIISGK